MEERIKELNEKIKAVYFAGTNYKVAEFKQFLHGVMVGIYDEPPSNHIDYLQLSSVNEIYDCHACQGGGCPTCQGYGWIIGGEIKV